MPFTTETHDPTTLLKGSPSVSMGTKHKSLILEALNARPTQTQAVRDACLQQCADAEASHPASFDIAP